MVVRTNIKTFACAVLFLFLATGALAACGGSSSTTSSSSTSSGSSSTSSSGSSTGTSSTIAGNRFHRVSGNITQYNSSAATLAIKESDGTTATFSTSKARILKIQKITQPQLSSLLGNSGSIVIVMGQQAGTGTYTAQTVVVSDRANGNGAGQGGVRPNGTPPAGLPSGTPLASGNRVIVVQNGKLQNNQLVGTNRGGQPITVNLSGTTTILQMVTATTSDLQAGQNVTIVSVAAQSGTTADARQIFIGDSSAM